MVCWLYVGCVLVVDWWHVDRCWWLWSLYISQWGPRKSTAAPALWQEMGLDQGDP